MLGSRLRPLDPISAAWNTVARFDDYETAQRAVDRLSDKAIWEIRSLLRASLVEEARRRVKASWIDRGASEAAKEHPRHGELVGWRVEDVLQHRDEHLRQQPAEQRGERQRRSEHQNCFAPEEGRGPPQ